MFLRMSYALRGGSSLVSRHWPEFSLLLLKHSQHPVGHHEPAYDVDRGEGDGERTENHGGFPAGSRSEHGPDQSDSGNRVGPGHQRCVQSRRDFGDDLNTDKNRQYKDRQKEHQRARPDGR